LHDLFSVTQADVAGLDPRARPADPTGHAEPTRDGVGTQLPDQVRWTALPGTSGLPTLRALLESAIAEDRSAFAATLGTASLQGVLAAIKTDVASFDPCARLSYPTRHAEPARNRVRA
jgi:hypothetical protein